MAADTLRMGYPSVMLGFISILLRVDCEIERIRILCSENAYLMEMHGFLWYNNNKYLTSGSVWMVVGVSDVLIVWH